QIPPLFTANPILDRPRAAAEATKLMNCARHLDCRAVRTSNPTLRNASSHISAMVRSLLDEIEIAANHYPS
ncbi:DUF3077 domain-containing protein, partial [Pseudomonas sp. S31]|uniref:hypothetical protein n=1 Tax=Pseudomonas sp. S31 TaxID=1564473 RepID=UPI001F3D6850